jgi:PAS domain S-box-containing protein
VLSRLKIAFRINLLLVLAAIGMLLCAGIGLLAVRAHMLEDKRLQLRLLMDLVVNDARGDMDSSGGSTTESGRAAFLDVLKSAKFGDNPINYFFVYDYNGVAVLHPHPSWQGQNRLNAVYPNGLKMVPIFIEAARSNPHGGFVDYEGPDGRGAFAPKLSHFRDVPELKLVVGLGADLENINAAFYHRLRLMAFLFASVVLAIGLAGVIISRSIHGPLSSAVRKIKSLADGDLDIAPANADDKSELGEVDTALDVLRANAVEQWALQEKVREQSHLLIKQHEEASEVLRKSEELWRQFVDQAPLAMLILDRNMIHLACSRRWVELHGVEAGIGCSHYDLFTEIPQHWKEAHRRALAGEVVSADEEMFVRPDGGVQWVRWEVRPWLTKDQSIGGISIMTEDVTDRVLAVRALRENELRMRLSQDAAKAGSWESKSSDTNYVWSENIWKLFGLKPHQCEPTREAWLSTVHPDDRDHVRNEIKKAAIAGATFEVQWRVKRPEGEPERWLFARGSPLTGAAPDHYFGVVIDITEQKLMEQALRESEMRMRLAQEAARVAAWEWKLADNSLQLPDSSWSLNGVEKPADWKPSFEGWAAIAHPADRERATTVVMEAASLGQGYEVEWRFNTPEGEPERWFLTRGRPLAGADGRPDRYFGVNIDITKQKLMEGALRESEERLKFALTVGEVGTFELSLDTGEITACDQTLALMSFPPGTPLTLESALQRIYPDDLPPFQESLQRVITKGAACDLAWRAQIPDGSIRWLETKGEKRTVAGRQVIVGLIQDITKKVEQKEAVERASKAKSEFLSNMSHELRTPMHAILGYSEICASAAKEGSNKQIEKYINNITKAGERLLTLLNDLLDLAKMEAGRMEYKIERADLKDVVTHTLMELDPLIKSKNLQMRVKLDEHTDALFDKAHLIQVMINLVSNAIKFSSAGSCIGIDLSEDRLENGERGIRCRVVDEGPGIPDEELEAVFDKFIQSTKTKTGKGGTGLGLAICAHIIKGHGGAIWAENAKPSGAAFTFVIPRDHDASGHGLNGARAGV